MPNSKRTTVVSWGGAMANRNGCQKNPCYQPDYSDESGDKNQLTMMIISMIWFGW